MHAHHQCVRWLRGIERAGNCLPFYKARNEGLLAYVSVYFRLEKGFVECCLVYIWTGSRETHFQPTLRSRMCGRGAQVVQTGRFEENWSAFFHFVGETTPYLVNMHFPTGRQGERRDLYLLPRTRAETHVRHRIFMIFVVPELRKQIQLLGIKAKLQVCRQSS